MAPINNVNISNRKSDTLLKGIHVLVKDNKIEQISAEPLAVVQTDNVTLIDGGGCTMAPGFVDG